MEVRWFVDLRYHNAYQTGTRESGFRYVGTDIHDPQDPCQYDRVQRRARFPGGGCQSPVSTEKNGTSNDQFSIDVGQAGLSGRITRD